MNWIVVKDVIMKSNAGYYVGSYVLHSNGECDPYDRSTGYYPNEILCQVEHPYAVPFNESYEKEKIKFIKN